MANVAFGIPAYDNKVCLDTATSLAQTRVLLEREGHGSASLSCGGSVYIDGARDELIASFLKTDCTHMMAIDADMGWDGDDVLKLLAHDRNMVCAMYCHKKAEPKFTARLTREWDGGLLKAEAVPAGFVLMKREAVQQMWDHYWTLRYEFQGRELTALHYMYLAGGGMVREDIAFGMRWSDIGDGFWIDPTITPRHWDGRQCYRHSFLDYISGTAFGRGLKASEATEHQGEVMAKPDDARPQPGPQPGCGVGLERPPAAVC
jgi:hypothetical protein